MARLRCALETIVTSIARAFARHSLDLLVHGRDRHERRHDRSTDNLLVVVNNHHALVASAERSYSDG